MRDAFEFPMAPVSRKFVSVPLFNRFAQIAVVATFLLLLAGGLVTSTDSGLAVPDWPLSYGTLFPPMVGGILYEHGHRLIAALVGLMIAVLSGWLWRREPRRWVRRIGYAAGLAVILQAALGGLTVLLMLPPAISVAHACLGQIVFCLVVILAVVTSPVWPPHTRDAGDRSLAGLCCSTTALLLLQVLLGAVIRHTGLAVVPHLVGAGVVFLVMGVMAWRIRRIRRNAPGLCHLATALLLGVIGQAALGWLALTSRDHVLLTTAHQGLGALILAGSCALSALVLPPGTRAALDRLRRRVADYAALTKPRLTVLALLAALVGFLMGSSRPLDWFLLVRALVGAALIGGGGNALNQWLERDADALMLRTRSRPLPAGRLTPAEAARFGLALSIAGVSLLAWSVNGLTGWLAAITLVSYVGVYTPLKRRTSCCTLVGAIPGAIPPLLGWASARGSLALEAWVLFAIVYLWQLPHFLSIAWVHREEYARAKFRMLPVVDPDGFSTARQMVLYGLALLPTSLLPTVLGVAGELYFVGSALAGVWFVGMTVAAARRRSNAVAHRVFLASIGYLAVVLCLLVVDRTPI